jgi:hypothetical protein
MGDPAPRHMHYGSVTEALHNAIQKSSPRNDVQLSLKSQAVAVRHVDLRASADRGDLMAHLRQLGHVRAV